MTEVQMNAISNPAEGLMVYCTNCNPKGPYYFDGSNWVNFSTNNPSDISETDVYNPSTGKIWMDRNLGASQVASSSTDEDAFGDVYQWGRLTDGHEKRSSTITSSRSNGDEPGHSRFIYGAADWRIPGNDDLWQGENGINNPCPSGYRIPTEAEWNAEYASWDSQNSAGAFASTLKLTITGERNYVNGVINYVGTRAAYWASTTPGDFAVSLLFHSTYSGTITVYRSYGASVRCIKD